MAQFAGSGRDGGQQPVRRQTRVKLPLRLPRPLAQPVVEALLESMTCLRDLAMVLLMLDGGLRPGEVLGLHLEDISFGRRRVTVRKRDDHPGGARGKSRQERVVDVLEPRTLDAVNRYVLRERPSGSVSPFVFLVGGHGVRPVNRCPTPRWCGCSPAAWTGSAFGHRTKHPMLCVIPTRAGCGRPGCASWRFNDAWAMHPRSPPESIPESRTPRSGTSTAPRWGALSESWAGALERSARPSPRRHASEAEYGAWVNAFVPNQAARYERMAAYRRFLLACPDLEAWFEAPLLVCLDRHR